MRNSVVITVTINWQGVSRSHGMDGRGPSPAPHTTLSHWRFVSSFNHDSRESSSCRWGVVFIARCGSLCEDRGTRPNPIKIGERDEQEHLLQIGRAHV